MHKKIVKKIICPKCQDHWGDISIDDRPAGMVKPRDIKIIKGKKKRFANGEDLACPICGYAMTSWDMILLLADTNTGVLPNANNVAHQEEEVKEITTAPTYAVDPPLASKGESTIPLENKTDHATKETNDF
jgi:hypothetical protein